MLKLKFCNIVFIGAAGSGKGTQGDLIKNKFKLLKISVGDILREYMKNLDNKHTEIIKHNINQGKLIPSVVTNEIVAEYIDDKVFQNPDKYNGILYDGFPRQMEQYNFLNEFLKNNNHKIDIVVYIKIDINHLVERLSGRFSCTKCGEIYHKHNKPLKIENICDVCGNDNFIYREDDANKDAIIQRFKIFETETTQVLNEYIANSNVLIVDGMKTPDEISIEISNAIENLK